MGGRMSLIAALAVAALLHQSNVQQPTWKLGGTSGSGYTMDSTSGSALDARGATIALRGDSAPASAYGSLAMVLPADTLRSRRVRVEADIDARGVTGGATPWLRVDGPSGTLAIDNGFDRAVKGTATSHRQITLYVPANATRVVFGLLLSGSGEAMARGLRLVASPVIAVDAPLGPAAQRELDSAIAIVRRHALWRDTVTWSVVEPEVRAIAAGAQAPDEVHPAIRALLARLGDHHSFLKKPVAARAFHTGGAKNPRPVVKLMPEGVGYVSVPAYSGAEMNAMRAYARDLQDSIAAITPAAGCRWIVDLRTNGGGNMWPMLGGLRPVLGEVGLGSFVRAAGSAPLWHARDAVDVPPPTSLAGLDSAYVAVLTGPRTASSGEAVTISFRGRPHTRSFGLPTAGLSTANSGFTLPDSSMIFLTVSVEADRTGKRYGGKIEPDEVIPVAVDDASHDPQLARALAWLTSQRCRP